MIPHIKTPPIASGVNSYFDGDYGDLTTANPRNLRCPHNLHNYQPLLKLGCVACVDCVSSRCPGSFLYRSYLRGLSAALTPTGVGAVQARTWPRVTSRCFVIPFLVIPLTRNLTVVPSLHHSAHC